MINFNVELVRKLRIHGLDDLTDRVEKMLNGGWQQVPNYHRRDATDLQPDNTVISTRLDLC